MPKLFRAAAAAAAIAIAALGHVPASQAAATKAWPDGEVRYCHNSALLVPVGTQVALGQPVSLSGSTGESTGPHLHVEVYQQGQLVDPLTVFGSAQTAGYTP
ncbi:MAG: M23 family metallopeptidase [Bacillota bacterium]|nr:M23 family metallopeptidase [Bacillota bacterium]